MGDSIHLFELNEEMEQYLVKLEVPLPQPRSASRMPTPAELRLAAQSIPMARASISSSPGGTLDAIDLDTPHGVGASIYISRQDADDQPCRVYFKGAPELIVEVITALTHRTGPLVLIFGSGALPLVIFTEAQLSHSASRLTLN